MNKKLNDNNTYFLWSRDKDIHYSRSAQFDAVY